jgi:hypothetical protein
MRLVGSIPLPQVRGRIDHMAVDRRLRQLSDGARRGPP